MTKTMTKTMTVTMPASLYVDSDTCLADAAADYAKAHGLEGWDLQARWADDERDAIELTVPA
jgi:hypothetical protein